MDRRTTNIAALALALAVLIGVSAAAPAQETVLYRFKGGRDGAAPQGGLNMDASGTLYGTTFAGGKNAFCRGDCGTVFALTPPATGQTGWTETVLHRFRGAAAFGTENPSGRVIMDARGVLYGTTIAGGRNKNCGNCGTVFALSPPAAGGGTSWTETVLYSFSGGTDGAAPMASLIMDAAGALYGTTNNGGDTFGNGTVFKLVP
jgi:uncharacterized repeat protein (TIGR03803 family)